MKLIKRDLKIVDFNKDKLIRSIKNTSKDCNYQLLEADVNYILKEVLKVLREFSNNRDISSLEVRMVTYEVLYQKKFEKVANAYINQRIE